MSESPIHSANETLVASGLIELALGALTGWPYALAIDDPEAARRLGIATVSWGFCGLAAVAVKRRRGSSARAT
ncbi:MAG TPA: hypothetical protein VK790_10370 [Solirubrobacteraceae bacterium]|jgi:hypothetical protein|nr:hypothetical protein [Solirubrobacteraceae bacterium]